MKAVAVICEYNPFHTGHAYHIAAAKEQSGADMVVGIMSGCFVQRAEPAVISPALRTEAALLHGMDFVIEMPVMFSCGAGPLFAEGALRILSRIPMVKYIAMGVEDNGKHLQAIAALQSAEPPVYKEELQRCLKGGLSYANAVTEATVAAAKGRIDEIACRRILRGPNNILAIEYLKAMQKLHLALTPVFIARVGNDYNDTATNGTYISATAARNLLQTEQYDALRPYIPADCFEPLVSEHSRHSVKQEIYDALTIHALRTRSIGDALDCAEGLEEKLFAAANKYVNLSDILQACKSKRYTMSRLKRICLQTLLGIGKEHLSLRDNAMGRLIGFNTAYKQCIKALSGVAVKNSDYATNIKTAALAETDGTAGSLYALLTNRNGNLFWNRKPITVNRFS